MFVLVLGALLMHLGAWSQTGINNLWLGGYSEEYGLPWGGTDLNFITGNLVISQVDRQIDFYRTSANITDASGDLLFSTNGAFVANVTGDTLMNGTGLAPSDYTAMSPEGLNIPQAVMILPKPEETDIYYLFHGTYDDLLRR